MEAMLSPPFQSHEGSGDEIASISNRPRFSCRAQDPGDGKHAVWREKLTNQMAESFFAPEYKFVFTVNSFLLFVLITVKDA